MIARSDAMTHDYLDPVCGMRVESDKISAAYDGTRHVFCSTNCRDKFVADPIPYLASRASGAEQDAKQARRE